MLAIEIVEPGTHDAGRRAEAARIAAACHQQGVVTLTCGTWGNVLRLLPPLVIGEDLLDEAFDVVGRRRSPPPPDRALLGIECLSARAGRMGRCSDVTWWSWARPGPSGRGPRHRAGPSRPVPGGGPDGRRLAAGPVRPAGDELAPAYAGLGESASVEAAAMDCDVVLNGDDRGGRAGVRRWRRWTRAARWRWPTRRRWSSVGAAGHRPRRSRADGAGRRGALRARAVPAGRPPRRCGGSILTASGGPFRGRTRGELADVTVAQALAHPTWDMGPIITINSATLVNKGLEVIEAHLLFGVPSTGIEVVVHRPASCTRWWSSSTGRRSRTASPPIQWGNGAMGQWGRRTKTCRLMSLAPLNPCAACAAAPLRPRRCTERRNPPGVKSSPGLTKRSCSRWYCRSCS